MTLRCSRSGLRAESGIPQTGPPPNRCANVLPIVNEGNLLIGVSSEGERVVLRLDGELDLASVPTLEDAMMDATFDGMAEIVLDLRGVEFIDSTGLRAILLQDKRSTERGQTFALVRGSEQVQRLLDLTHVDEHLKIVSSPEEILP
jgi:anti-sigma B factor antagonist